MTEEAKIEVVAGTSAEVVDTAESATAPTPTLQKFQFGTSVSKLYNAEVEAGSLDEAVRIFDDWLRGSGVTLDVCSVQVGVELLGIATADAEGKLVPAGQIGEDLAAELNARPELNIDPDTLFFDRVEPEFEPAVDLTEPAATVH